MIWSLVIILATPFSADRVEILRDEGSSVVHLIGNVVIEDETRKITCREAYMYETEDYVNLMGDVVITDSNGRIFASEAKFIFENQQGFLRGRVVLERKEETIMADSLYYDGSRSTVDMFNNVRIDDLKNNLTANADQGHYKLEIEEGELFGEPRLAIAREEKDPITIRSRIFKLRISQNEFYGYDSVIALIDSIIVHSDTFMYDLKNDRGTMIRPEIIEKENRLTGDIGYFTMENKEIKSFTVENGWSRYYDKDGSENVVEGDSIVIEFDQGQASKIIVRGGPKGILYLKGEERTDDAGN
jgi:lipopolysaccharide export system protein LptA